MSGASPVTDDLVLQRADGKREVDRDRLADVDDDTRQRLRLKARKLGPHRVATRLQRLDRVATGFVRDDERTRPGCLFGQRDGDTGKDGPGGIDGIAIDLGTAPCPEAGTTARAATKHNDTPRDDHTHGNTKHLGPLFRRPPARSVFRTPKKTRTALLVKCEGLGRVSPRRTCPAVRPPWIGKTVQEGQSAGRMHGCCNGQAELRREDVRGTRRGEAWRAQRRSAELSGDPLVECSD